MTNLFLSITIATNIGICKINVYPTLPTHVYSIQVAGQLINPLGTTNWYPSWIFLGNYDNTNTFFDYTLANGSQTRFYRAIDEGTNW